MEAPAESARWTAATLSTEPLAVSLVDALQLAPMVLLSLFAGLEQALDQGGFYPPDKRESVIRNMRDRLHRMAMTEQDVRTFL